MDNDTSFAGEGAVANPLGSDPRALPLSPEGRPHFVSGTRTCDPPDVKPSTTADQLVVGKIEFAPRNTSFAFAIPNEPGPWKLVGRYFVLQRHIWPTSPPLYYAVVNGRYRWTAKLDEAIRVSRQQDAEALKDTLPSPLVGQIAVLECVGT